MTIRLANLDLEEVAADLVMLAHERVIRAARLLGPLVRVEVQAPELDLPEGLAPKDAIRRSFVYGTDLGLLIRDVVHYAKTGHGFSPESAMTALLEANHALALDLEWEPPESADVFTLPMQVVRHAVVGRVLLATHGNLPPMSLAALAGLEPTAVRAIMALGELRDVGGGVPHEDAERWLRARGIPGI